MGSRTGSVAAGGMGARRRTAPGGNRHSPPPPPRGGIAQALDGVLQDFRFALRTLTKAPVFTATAIVVLALGIGANASIFSLVNAVILQPLPFAEPHRLLSIWETNPERGWHRAQVAAANYLDWAAEARSFSDMAANQDWLDDVALTGNGEPRTLAANSITSNYFHVLGVELVLGPGLASGDNWSGGEPKVVVSHELWQGLLAGADDVIGQRLTIDDVPRTIVGVAPPGFAYPLARIDVWKPMEWNPEFRDLVFFRRAHGFRVVGRLAPEATVQAAETELAAIASRLEDRYPQTNVAMGTGVTPLHEWITGDTRRPLVVLLVSVGLVLLIGCANVASMQLARCTQRRREMSVRSALGAGRVRLLRQGLTESLLLSIGGGGAGLVVGAAGVRIVTALVPDEIPRLGSVALDGRVIAFTIGVSLVTALLFGTLPALRAAQPDLRRSLSSNRSSTTRRARRAAALLVAAEIALALPLAIGTGLMVRSLAHLQRVDLGFDPVNTIAVGISLPTARYSDGEEVTAFYDRLLESVRARSGVESAALGTRLAFVNQRWSSDFTVEGWAEDQYGVGVRHDEVSSGLFETLRVPLLAGRDFDNADISGPLVAVINQALADRYFPDQDPLGKRLCFSRDATECEVLAADAERVHEIDNWFEIIGVVGNVRRASLAGEEKPSIYALIFQDWTHSTFVMVRSERAAEDLAVEVRAAMQEIDPALPLSSVHVLEQVVADSVARERLVLRLLGAFSTAAVLLAALGVYGVMSQTARQASREIGIRMSLGAQRASMLRSVVGRGLVPVAVGIAAGLAAAATATRVLDSMLFGVGPSDPATYAVTAFGLFAIAILASYLPARRAVSVDPAIVLRSE